MTAAVNPGIGVGTFAGTLPGTCVGFPVVVRAASDAQEAIHMYELRDNASGISTDSLAFFRDHRHKLGVITNACVTFPGFGADEPYNLVLRDDHGARMLLSGCPAGFAGPGPRTAMQVLVEAGFAPQYADVVFTHTVVRLSRSVDGTTALEQATRPCVPANLQSRPRRLNGATGRSINEPQLMSDGERA